MMIRHRRSPTVAAICAAALILTACGGAGDGAAGGAPGAAGDPVPGGTARAIQIAEPRSLDPALMGNAYAVNGFLGNALYGTLMVNDAKTGEIEYKMGQEFATTDGGATFRLTLRPGLKFSDGTPFDAEAVKIAWDRMKDPKTGSSNQPEASMIASTEVVDATTLKITMAEPSPNYAQAIVTTSMNWVASPKALQGGQRAFDQKPIGAGPFTLKEWIRQGSIQLVKNPSYWDAPKPYLDLITLSTTSDAAQRVNSLVSGGADAVMESNWSNLAKATNAGYPTDLMTLHGGLYLALNTRRAPFNDVRARQAVAAALDLDAVNQSVYDGKARVADTLFTDSSPFYSEAPLIKKDHAKAQRLFDELAAEGKRVSFTFKALPSTEGRGAAESVQAQLSAFDNVDAKVEVVDFSQLGAMHTSHDFDIFISSAYFIDPEPRLSSVFSGTSRVNMSGIDDPALNAALRQGKTATSPEERKAAYDTVQQRLTELVPVIFTTRAAPSAMMGKNVHGAVQYGNGSLLPEELWLQR